MSIAKQMVAELELFSNEVLSDEMLERLTAVMRKRHADPIQAAFMTGVVVGYLTKGTVPERLTERAGI